MPSSGNWPRRGMMFSGESYQLPLWEPHTVETESGYLLPTPTASESGTNKSLSPGAAVRPSLHQLARNGMLPTPKSSDAEKGGPNCRFGRGNLQLPGVACRLQELLPTPTRSDASDRKYMKQKNGSRSDTLPGAASRLSGLLPTPKTRDWKDGLSPGKYGKHSPSVAVVMAEAGHMGYLNPQFVAWMMGLPVNALEPLDESQFPREVTGG